MSGERTRPAPLTGTLERGLAVLSLLAEEGECSVGGISDSLGLSRSTTYRLVDALRELGFVSPVRGSTRIGLGMKAVEVGVAAVARTDIFSEALPVMRVLADTRLGTAFMAVPDEDSVVYVAREEGPQAFNLSARLGSRRPLHCTGLGKAYLSALPADERRSRIEKLELSRQTTNTITDPVLLGEELDRTTEQGYAVDAIENEEGVACVAAPVRDHRGRPVAAISVAGAAERILAEAPRLGRQVEEAAMTVSRGLGYVGTVRDVLEQNPGRRR